MRDKMIKFLNKRIKSTNFDKEDLQIMTDYLNYLVDNGLTEVKENITLEKFHIDFQNRLQVMNMSNILNNFYTHACNAFSVLEIKNERGRVTKYN